MTAAPNPGFRIFTLDLLMNMPIRQHFGFEVTRVEPGLLELVQPHRAQLSFDGTILQAGAVGALADIAGGGACLTMLPAGWSGATIDYTVKFLSPAQGDRLLARGRVLQAGRTLSIAAAEVFAFAGTSETLCATALVTTRN